MIPSFVRPEWIGRRFVMAFRDWGAVLTLIRYTIMHLRRIGHPVVSTVLQRQVYFTGIEALPAVSFIALLTGIVITTQTTSLVGNMPGVLGRVMLWVVVRELGPVLTAIVIIARSSSASASELAAMKIRGEMNSLRLMGIDPMDALIIPRIVGVTLSVVAVTFYFQVTAILGGFAFTALWHGTPMRQDMEGLIQLLSLKEVIASFTKAFVFGLMISATSCYFGLRAKGAMTAVPQAATGAVMRNLMTLFLLDGLITYLFFV
jgi:phospholipid/cholesterol/gamma-HCH transport system permease protein